MKIRNIDDLTGVFADMDPVVGVGVTAFNRIGPAFFYPNYQIVCYKDGSDIGGLRRLTSIRSVQSDFAAFGDIRRNNTLAILRQKGVQQYLKSLSGRVRIFVYRSTENVENLCDQLGLEVFANRHNFRDRFENKSEFFKIGREVGLPMISGEQWEIDNLDVDAYHKLRKRLGEKLVFQLTDFSLGGGQGTFFIVYGSDFDNYKEFVERKRQEKPERPLTFVNVTKFVDGMSASIAGCATRHGVLTGVVQTQVMDVAELGESERSGVFRGHDWSYQHYESWVQNQADSIIRKLGEYMYDQGYKGVFGVDLIVDRQQRKVYLVECNPRYTGAFPVYTMLQMQKDEIPLDVFQLLEFFDINYEIDFESISKSWKQPKTGAHLILHSPYKEEWSRAKGNLSAGVYRIKGSRLEKVGDGVLYDSISDGDEFVLTDGCPRPGTLTKPLLRVGKLIFKKGVLSKPGELTEFGVEAVMRVMEGFDFQKVSDEEQKRLDGEYNYQR